MARSRVQAVRSLPRHIRPPAPRIPFTQIRHASTAEGNPSIADPNMTGGYINPPPVKRALRDPYGDWWDKQERRNFGEPVHEDNDILNVFSTEPYTHMKPSRAILHFLTFILAGFGGAAVVRRYYSDTPSVPQTYANGLEDELGGKGALLAPRRDEDSS